MTVARLIDRLEAAGCVERRPDPADRRAKRIYLTKKAGTVLAQLRAIGDELMSEVLGPLSPAQLTQLFDLLSVVKVNLLESAGRADRVERASA
jgi:DNA-binding MarR family transcriptional regulator